MTDSQARLSIREKGGYALGDFAANLFFQSILVLQFSFYTDTFGLSPRQAGLMFLVVGLTVAVLSPLVGFFADCTHSPRGRFRSWLLWTSLPFGVFGVLAFSRPHLPPSGMLAYAWITYLLLRIVYIANNVPYAALNGVITNDSHERTSVASYRQICAIIASFFVHVLALPMVTLIGKGDSAKGYQVTMAFFSLAATLLILCAYRVTEERVAPAPQQRLSARQYLSDLLHNRPWIVLSIATLLHFTAVSIRGSAMLPYFTYCARRPILFSWFNGIGLLALLAGAALSPTLSRMYGKRRVFIMSMILSGLSCLILFPIDPTAVIPVVLTEVSRQFAHGCAGPLLWAMIADVADYAKWKTGRQATATVTAATVMALWIGLAFGGAITAWLFSSYGYNANSIQNESTLFGIRRIVSIYPGIVFLAVACCMYFYRIEARVGCSISPDQTQRKMS